MSSDSYKVVSKSWFFRDDGVDETRFERLNFHLKTGDYFPMLATILGFVQETVKTCNCSVETDLTIMEAAVLENTRKDLAYLHKNFRIVPSDSKE